MLTIIGQKKLQTIIQLSGAAIRDFLAHADPCQFKGEAQLAIKAFQANPLDYSDDKLVAYGEDTEKAINYFIRIEVRSRTKQGAAQMVSKGIWGPWRDKAAAKIYKECKNLGLGLHLKLAGTSTIEFNVDGVDKSLPIRFLQGAFEDVLDEMNYRPGIKIDSRQSKTVIAADGDGTIYDGPRLGFLPTLAQSPVCGALYAYLQAGGIFMLVSGNDLNRSFQRMVDSLPKEFYSRILVAGNGGAELVYVNSKGHAAPISSYRNNALDISKNKTQRQSLDMVYIGDDGSKEGNDYPAFKAIGFKHSVLVAPRFLKDYAPSLKSCFVRGRLQGTRRYLKNFLKARV